MTIPRRDDLLALSPEAVAALANVGLVKRAQREIAEGKGPALAVEADGTVVGTFAGTTPTNAAIVARLVPNKPLRDCPCTCGAVTVCRHRVATALAYPEWARGAAAAGEDEPPEHVEWNPGSIEDDALAKFVGKRTLDRARVTERGGIVIVVVPWNERDRTPAAKLPSCTVRFHVPNDLAYARCDCATGTACEHVVLGVWAFREASAASTGVPLVAPRPISLGAAAKSGPAAAQSDTPSRSRALEDAAAMAEELLRMGVSNAPQRISERFARVRAALEAERLVWPLHAIESLESLVEAYRARSSRYQERRAAELVIEVVARHRATTRPAELPARFILGEGQPRETLLDHLRLVSLGARVEADNDARLVEVFLADPDSGDVLVFEKKWEPKEGDPAPATADLARRAALPGTPLTSVAHGQIVTRAAKRRANGLVVFGSNRSHTSVTPQRGDWGQLPAPLLFDDFGALEAYLRSLAPRMLRPRVLAEGFHVVRIAAVSEVAYVAAEQRVVVVVRDQNNALLLLERVHTSVTPNAIDAVASAAESGLRFAAGPVRRTSRGLVLEPFALVAASPGTGGGSGKEDGDAAVERVIVPDLAPAPSTHRAERAVARPREDDLSAALEAAGILVAETVHVGLSRLPSTYGPRLARNTAQLGQVGLEGLARAATRFATALGSHEASPRFFDFALLVELARELA